MPRCVQRCFMIRRIMKRQIMHQCSRVCRGVWAAFSNIIKIWGKEHGDDNKLQTSAMGQGGPDQNAGLQCRVCEHRRGLKAETDARSEADGTAAERITALAQTIANGKICRIKYGSYAGNGLSGAENPNKIDCGFYPLLVMVSEQSDTQHWALRGVSGFYNSNNRGNARYGTTAA